MHKLVKKRKRKSVNKVIDPLLEPIMKNTNEKTLLCNIMKHTIHSQNYFFRRINENNIFEDIILGQKISFPVEKIKGKFYLNSKDYEKFQQIYSNEKEIHFNSINITNFAIEVGQSRSTLYNNLNKTHLIIYDKLNTPYKIKTYKINNEYYISKKDAQTFIDLNSNIYLLSDFSGRLFGIDRQCLWKRIKKENSKYYINFESPDGQYKLELLMSKNKTFYITKDKYLELEQFIYEKNKIMLNYLGLKEAIKSLGINFKGNMYKKIKNNEIRFLLNENLISMKLFKFNSNYYLEKEEIKKLTSPFSEYKFYSVSSFVSLLKSINYDKRFITQISKIKSKDFDLNLNIENINFTIHILCYNGKHYFSKTEIQKVYLFVKSYREKMENKSKLIDLAKKYNFNTKHLRKINSNDKLISKSKKMSVQLYKIKDIYYYNKEDEEKIIKIFN